MTRQARLLTANLTKLALFSLIIAMLVACETEASATPQAQSTSVAATAATSSTQNSDVALTSQDQVETIQPLAPDQTAAPVRIRVPDAGIDAPVTAMGWRIVTVEGERTTVWDVPEESVGWHVNSVGAGGAGNVVLSGRQYGDSAVFAPLALGAISVGANIFLTDADGLTFVYQVIEVTAPIPIAGASPEDQAQAEKYFAQDGQARLTLASGWPEFTTTHRIFAVAEFEGVLQ